MMDLLRNINETKVLKWFIPATLFAESSLPQVLVESQGSNETLYENVEDAIKMYTPGRVTFRVSPSHGNLIPIRTKNGRSWELYGYLDYEELRLGGSKIAGIKSELPEDVLKLIEETFGTYDFKVVIPIKINMENYTNHRDKVIWQVYGKRLHTDRIRIGSGTRHDLRVLFLVDKSSMTFPLILNAFYLPKTRGEGEKINKYLPHIPEPFIKIQRGEKGEVARLVYGFLARIKARIAEPKLLPLTVRDTERLPSVDLTGVGLPTVNERLGLYGYLIEDTNVFSLSLPASIQFIDELIDRVNSLKNKQLSSLNLADRYVLLMFNDILYNSVVYALLRNPRLIAELQYAYLADVLRTYLSFGQVILSDKSIISDKILENLINLLGRLSEKDLQNLDIYSCDAYCFMLKVFKSITSSRGRLDVERRASLERILPELSFFKNLEDTVFLAKLFSFILLHTAYHAFIKNILGTVGGIDDKLVQEGSLNSPWRFPSGDSSEMFIYELSDGGIGAVETVLNNYSDNPRSFIDDVLRALGHCIIGVPEELVYYAYLKTRNVNEISREVILSVIDELEIIVMRDEIEEALRLLDSLKHEFSNKGSEYLSDTLEARKNFEEEFLRTPTLDELILYILKHINKYPRIRQRLIETLATLINSPLHRVYRHALGEYINYKKATLDTWASDFLDDLAKTLNGSDVLLNFIRSSADKKEKRDRQNFVMFLVRNAYNIIRATFSRFFLLSCVSACGWCYLNTKSCEETDIPDLQALTLDRRLLNVYVAWALRRALEHNINPSINVIEGRDGDVVVRVNGKDIAIKVNRQLA